MNRTIDGRIADVVGGADDLAALHAAAGEPEGITAGGMIAAFFIASAFSAGSSAEFAGPEDQSAVEQAALLQIHQQSGNRLIGLAGERGVIAKEIGVSIPEGEAKLHEAHAALDEPAGEETVGTEFAGRRLIQAVKLADVIGFAGDVKNFWSGGLHAIGQLVTADTGVELRVQRIFILMETVVGADQIELFAAIVECVIGWQREI